MPIIIHKRTGADGKELPTERKKASIDEKNDPFARQKLVSWWDQDKIENARVLVMGAGAIGNETLKNLALLGFKNLFICDMDEIELSNLSRTLLFRPSDEGKEKAKVAAERVREMCLAKDAKVDFFTGDVMFELGIGIFRYFDLILGCLDNDATRYYIDRAATMFGKPWINAGISGLYMGLQTFFCEENGVCFHCGADEDAIARIMSRKASCGKTVIKDLSGGKVPTVQVASAMVSALQTQEAVKFVCGKELSFGSNYYFDGAVNSFSSSRTKSDGACRHHLFPRIREVKQLKDINNSSTLRELLLAASAAIGKDVVLDLSEENGRDFITHADCVYCGASVKVGVPRYRFREEMATCVSCLIAPPDVYPSEPWVYPVSEYSLASDEELLALPLYALGIPPLHVMRVTDADENVYYVETTGDLPLICPENYGKM